MPADIYALIAAKRDEILAVAARYGVSNVRIFGSVARREAREDSDLDLLVTFPPGASLFDLIGLEQDLADLLGLTVEVASDRGLRERIRATVTQEAVPI
ncbi:MAG: nucleotidyltransferase family protein [Methanospirillum sp.]